MQSEAEHNHDASMVLRTLDSAERGFRILADGIPNACFYLNSQFIVEFANSQFTSMLGKTVDAVIGQHIGDVLGPEEHEKHIAQLERVLHGEQLVYECEVKDAQDRVRSLRIAIRPVIDHVRGVHGAFSAATDVTELKELERELLRSNADLEQFAYVASHDLKAPLRAIELLVRWTREAVNEGRADDVHENLDLLERRAQRLTRLLDDVLSYSRAGRKIGNHGEVDCQALVEDVIHLAAPPETISIEIAGTLPTFATYAAPLEQVFRNLIGNAIKHHPGPRGRVTVSCSEQEHCYVFCVQDDGAGISQEYADRVFQMFQTLKPRDDVEGSGMGLAIVSRIVQWQGGRVWFEPPPDGRGTAFKFEWSKPARVRPPSPPGG